jgi:hypothetical protein
MKLLVHRLLAHYDSAFVHQFNLEYVYAEALRKSLKKYKVNLFAITNIFIYPCALYWSKFANLIYAARERVFIDFTNCTVIF